MSLRNEQCNKVCRILDDVLANRPTERDSLITAVRKAFGALETEPQWILCSERLPEEHIGFYLVTVQKRRITALNVVGCDNAVHDIDIARWDYDRRAPQRGYHWCKEDKVIAWMELPKPYGGEPG